MQLDRDADRPSALSEREAKRRWQAPQLSVLGTDQSSSYGTSMSYPATTEGPMGKNFTAPAEMATSLNYASHGPGNQAGAS